MEKLIIQQGDSARIELVLPIDKMAQVEDVVCTVGSRLSYSLSKGTLIPTATANVFHVNIQSIQSQKHTGNLEVVVAIDYSDIGVKKTKRAENLVVQVVRNENYFNNNSISELVSAVVIVTIDEDVVTSIPILASYLVINGGGGGATNLGYLPSPTNGIVTSDTGTDATIPLANNTNAGLLSPSEKTAITHSNRSVLDNITEAFTTGLKNAYDGAVTWVTTNGANVLAHLSRTDNPHSVTKTQVGLSNVDNTTDLLKPISTATQTALNTKQNTLTAGTNISIVGDTISASGGGGGAVKLFNKTKVSYTGTTAETILGTPILIPANTFANLDALVFSGVFQKLGFNSVMDVRIYVNSIASLSGAQLIWRPRNQTSGDGGTMSYTVRTAPYIIKSNNLYGSWIAAGIATNNYLLNSESYQFPLLKTFNPTIDNYIFATNTLTDGSDTFIQEFLQIETI